jgi:type III pantothenate kinase
MLLAMDIGNTTIALGVLENGELRFLTRIATVADHTEADYRPVMEKQLGGWAEKCGHAVISSVVSGLTGVLTACVRDLLGVEPLVIRHDLRLGITVGLENPEKVGADRLVDAAWAAEKYGVPLVTVDLGTATTINVVDGSRVFRGGVIAAGVTTGLRALDSRCAALGSVEAQVPASVIGRNTQQAMESGAVYGAAAMIDGLVQRIREELGSDVRLVLTGGHSSLVSSLVRYPHVQDPQLLLQGLSWLYSRNR